MKKTKTETSSHVRIEKEKAYEVADFLFALGNEFLRIKNMGAAFDSFKYSLDLNPKKHASVYNLGVLYTLNKNNEGAYMMFNRAHEMMPDDVTTEIALAESARKIGKIEESRKLLAHLLDIDRSNYMVLSAMAILMYDEGDIAEAQRYNHLALTRKPDDPLMNLNRTLVAMMYGNWADEWPHYEYFLSYRQNERMKQHKIEKSWYGQECEGQTLLVVSDQGSGDAIQFSRFLIEAKRKGNFAKLVYLVQPDLKSLLTQVEGVDEVIAFGERMELEHDQFSSLLGIMRVLKVSPDTCHRPPNIVAEARLVDKWRYRIGAPGEELKVGIVWAGDPLHGNDHARSISIDKLAPLFNTEGAKFYSMQVGKAIEQLGALDIKIEELGSDFRSFADTAAAIECLDLIISCDTSVAHLAGCMGKACWVLVPNPPEWRWLMNTDETYWYEDNFLIFRQDKPRDWRSVVDRVKEELKSRIASHRIQVLTLQ